MTIAEARSRFGYRIRRDGPLAEDWSIVGRYGWVYVFDESRGLWAWACTNQRVGRRALREHPGVFSCCGRPAEIEDVGPDESLLQFGQPDFELVMGYVRPYRQRRLQLTPQQRQARSAWMRALRQAQLQKRSTEYSRGRKRPKTARQEASLPWGRVG